MKETLFKILFEQSYQQLCRHAYKYLKDDEAAEDVVQDVFIHIIEKHPEIIDTEAAKPYLFVSVRNRCISILRKKVIITTGHELPEIPDPNIEPRPELDIQTLIAEALDSLSPKCREVFELSRLKKMKYAEIAEHLNISIKTVENQMGTAQKRMRQFAKEHAIFFVILLCLIYSLYFR